MDLKNKQDGDRLDYIHWLSIYGGRSECQHAVSYKKGAGLNGLNDWLSLAFVIFTNLPEDFD